MSRVLPSLSEKIRAYHNTARHEHHRYRSWEHCFSYFRSQTPQKLSRDANRAALQLGFYLASWGMYRGSGFLLQYTYTVHRPVIKLLASRDFAPLWENEFGASKMDDDLGRLVLKAADEIRTVYSQFAVAANAAKVTDTLVTKILLGTIGCIPGCDRFFIDGFKAEGLRRPRLNSDFISCLRDLTRKNLSTLRAEQTRIESITKMRYPLMKLVDMYFWQVGYEKSVS